MNKDSNILAELASEAPALMTIDRSMPYALPNTYFEDISDTILAQISTINLPKATAPFTVPSNYFDNLSDRILTTIHKVPTATNEVAKELETIAPVLNTIDKTNVYTYPQTYFTTLKVDFNSKAFVSNVVLMSSIKRKIVYIAAACMIGIMVAGAFVFFKNSNKPDYAAYKKIDVNSSINKVSNEDLLNYLENEHVITNSNSLTTLDVKLPNLQDHIQTISDEELRQYLKEIDMPANEESQVGI